MYPTKGWFPTKIIIHKFWKCTCIILHFQRSSKEKRYQGRAAALFIASSIIKIIIRNISKQKLEHYALCNMIPELIIIGMIYFATDRKFPSNSNFLG